MSVGLLANRVRCDARYQRGTNGGSATRIVDGILKRYFSILILTNFLTGADVFAVGGKLFAAIATHKIAYIFAAFLLIALGLCIDLYTAAQRAKRETEVQAQRLIVFRATMRTVQDIVNNALYEMQLFRLDAVGLMPEESLRSFDDLINRTVAKLKALSDLESIPERDSAIGRL